MRHHFWIGLVLLLVGTSAYPISRVGNGLAVGDGTYQMPVASEFCAHGSCFVTKNAQGQLVLNDANARIITFDTFGIAQPATLFGDDFQKQFPEWGGLSRAALVAQLTEFGWQRLETRNPCVEAWEKDGQGAFSAFATWGAGRGSVLYAVQDAELRASAISMIEALELGEGACAWN